MKSFAGLLVIVFVGIAQVAFGKSCENCCGDWRDPPTVSGKIKNVNLLGCLVDHCDALTPSASPDTARAWLLSNAATCLGDDQSGTSLVLFQLHIENGDIDANPPPGYDQVACKTVDALNCRSGFKSCMSWPHMYSPQHCVDELNGCFNDHAPNCHLPYIPPPPVPTPAPTPPTPVPGPTPDPKEL